MRRHAILLIEGRGQAIHFREDANFNLLQAGFIARELLDSGYDVRLRVILDPGQSIEEYSVLCHAEDDVMEARRASVADAADVSAARFALVREIREHLPITIDAMPLGGISIEDRIFFAAMAARVTGVNERVLDSLRALRHPLVNRDAVDEYEALLRAYTGLPYLDLEERIARDALRRCTGEDLDFRIVSRRDGCPTTWLHDPLAARIVDTDLAAKERGGGGDFHDRLIGLFTTVYEAGEERPYFNSPVCVRREHGKVRILARDRFGLLALKGSERMKFDRFRELIEAQNEGRAERLVMLKYPYTAHYIAAGISAEVSELAGSVRVVFIDGIAGALNPATGGIIDSELRAALAGRAEYVRVFGVEGSRQMLPDHPGGLPVVFDRLWERIETTLPTFATV
jgi:hypothetical protein